MTVTGFFSNIHNYTVLYTLPVEVTRSPLRAVSKLYAEIHALHLRVAHQEFHHLSGGEKLRGQGGPQSCSKLLRAGSKKQSP